ncbi:hypothetical protein Dimus_028018 [Dionaea muscipula]
MSSLMTKRVPVPDSGPNPSPTGVSNHPAQPSPAQPRPYRLRTRDRLMRMGITTEVGCVLCDHGYETKDHLFLYYTFSSEVREKLMHRLDLQCVGTSLGGLVAVSA